MRLVVEKPCGTDLYSAHDLNVEIQQVFAESQVYRIDHYLGNETVQNILAFRQANGIFEPIWNRNYVDHVQIPVAETDGVGTRGGYYQQVGEFALRGQYTTGTVDGRPAAGYRSEAKVAPDSCTETFVVAKLDIDNWRCAGTPFYLRYGRPLPQRMTEIAIQFKRAPQSLFLGADQVDPNVLAIRIQPDEGISLRFAAKTPGALMQLQDVDMNFLYRSAFAHEGDEVDAYERLLLDATLGDRMLFTRSDEVEEAWSWAESVIEGFERRPGNVRRYSAGTWGPPWADAFIERDGRHGANPNRGSAKPVLLLDSEVVVHHDNGRN